MISGRAVKDSENYTRLSSWFQVVYLKNVYQAGVHFI